MSFWWNSSASAGGPLDKVTFLRGLAEVREQGYRDRLPTGELPIDLAEARAKVRRKRIRRVK